MGTDGRGHVGILSLQEMVVMRTKFLVDLRYKELFGKAQFVKSTKYSHDAAIDYQDFRPSCSTTDTMDFLSLLLRCLRP